jgi:hypothetical protein
MRKKRDKISIINFMGISRKTIEADSQYLCPIRWTFLYPSCPADRSIHPKRKGPLRGKTVRKENKKKKNYVREILTISMEWKSDSSQDGRI